MCKSHFSHVLILPRYTGNGYGYQNVRYSYHHSETHGIMIYRTSKTIRTANNSINIETFAIFIKESQGLQPPASLKTEPELKSQDGYHISVTVLLIK
jgi:hypothetical protein